MYHLLFNILTHLFSSRNSPNLLNDLCPTSQDGLLGVRILSSAEGLGMIIKTALGLELRMSSLAAILIYVKNCSDKHDNKTYVEKQNHLT